MLEQLIKDVESGSIEAVKSRMAKASITTPLSWHAFNLYKDWLEISLDDLTDVMKIAFKNNHPNIAIVLFQLIENKGLYLLCMDAHQKLTAIFVLAAKNGCTSILKSLHKRYPQHVEQETVFSYDKKLLNYNCKNGLWFAILERRSETVKYLIENFGKTITENSNSALLCATVSGDLEILNQILLIEGVDATALDNQAIFIAAALGHFPIVKRLLQIKGVSPINNKYLAFRMAARYGHKDILDFLINWNAVNHIDKELVCTNFQMQLCSTPPLTISSLSDDLYNTLKVDSDLDIVGTFIEFAPKGVSLIPDLKLLEFKLYLMKSLLTPLDELINRLTHQYLLNYKYNLPCIERSDFSKYLSHIKDQGISALWNNGSNSGISLLKEITVFLDENFNVKLDDLVVSPVDYLKNRVLPQYLIDELNKAKSDIGNRIDMNDVQMVKLGTLIQELNNLKKLNISKDVDTKKDEIQTNMDIIKASEIVSQNTISETDTFTVGCEDVGKSMTVSNDTEFRNRLKLQKF